MGDLPGGPLVKQGFQYKGGGFNPLLENQDPTIQPADSNDWARATARVKPTWKDLLWGKEDPDAETGTLQNQK